MPVIAWYLWYPWYPWYQGNMFRIIVSSVIDDVVSRGGLATRASLIAQGYPHTAEALGYAARSCAALTRRRCMPPV
jgi:hypothetical protein